MFGTCVPDTVLNAGYPHVKTSSAVKKTTKKKKQKKLIVYLSKVRKVQCP